MAEEENNELNKDPYCENYLKGKTTEISMPLNRKYISCKEKCPYSHTQVKIGQKDGDMLSICLSRGRKANGRGFYPTRLKRPF